MQRENRFRLVHKLLTLTILVICLGILTSSQPASAANPGLCDFQRSLCQISCLNEGSEPQSYACAYGCDIAYETCMSLPN
jgi:hypothetical protein